jgi:hypothetical protein
VRTIACEWFSIPYTLVRLQELKEQNLWQNVTIVCLSELDQPQAMLCTWIVSVICFGWCSVV